MFATDAKEEVSENAFVSEVESLGFQVGEELVEVALVAISDAQIVNVQIYKDSSILAEEAGVVVTAGFETFPTENLRQVPEFWRNTQTIKALQNLEADIVAISTRMKPARQTDPDWI